MKSTSNHVQNSGNTSGVTPTLHFADQHLIATPISKTVNPAVKWGCLPSQRSHVGRVVPDQHMYQLVFVINHHSNNTWIFNLHHLHFAVKGHLSICGQSAGYGFGKPAPSWYCWSPPSWYWAGSPWYVAPDNGRATSYEEDKSYEAGSNSVNKVDVGALAASNFLLWLDGATTRFPGNKVKELLNIHFSKSLYLW